MMDVKTYKKITILYENVYELEVAIMIVKDAMNLETYIEKCQKKIIDYKKYLYRLIDAKQKYLTNQINHNKLKLSKFLEKYENNFGKSPYDIKSEDPKYDLTNIIIESDSESDSDYEDFLDFESDSDPYSEFNFESSDFESDYEFDDSDFYDDTDN